MTTTNNGMPDYAEEMDPKYDNLFKSIVTGEWSNASGGNVDSPQGYFALIEIEERDLFEMRQVFEKEIDSGDGLSNLPDLPLGYFITQETHAGIIYVYRYATVWEAKQAYRIIVNAFNEWDDTK